MVKRFQFRKRLSRLTVRVFLLILLCVLFPLYLMFIWLKYSYEDYLRQEISNKVVQGISNGEEAINEIFEQMANLSNMIVFNEDLRTAFQEHGTYYEKTKVVDGAISSLIINNFVTTRDLMVTIFDTDRQIYTNWPVNFDDYDFLLEKEWVLESIRQRGHITWNLASPGYIKGEEDTVYTSLSRSILANGVTGSYLGTVVISINQKVLSNTILQYRYDVADCVYVCDSEGEIFLMQDDEGAISAEDLREVLHLTDGQGDAGVMYRASGSQYLVSTYKLSRVAVSSGTELRVVHFTNYREIDNQMESITVMANICLFLSFFVVLILAGVISEQIARPIKKLALGMEQYSIDADIKSPDLSRKDEVGQLNRSFYNMSLNIKKLFGDLNREYKIKEKYRFESLRAQLNPHFLFNTLNSIRWMSIIRKADNITESIDALAQMLKYSMSRGSEMVTLEEELGNIRNYVFIQNCRYGDRYEIDIDVDSALLSLKVIKFILQPIVENALIHAFKETRGIGVIRISAKHRDEKLMLYVEDNGCGISEEKCRALNETDENSRRSGKKLTGIGYANVHERIRVSYGEEFGLEIQNNSKKGIRVVYMLPVIREEEADI